MKIEKDNLAGYVASHIVYFSYNCDNSEQNEIRKTSDAFGRLIEVLLPKLTDSEIDYIVNNSNLQNIEIER